MQLTDKIIAITGAAQGLGLAMAKHLSHSGARVAMLDMQQGPLDEAVALVKEQGGEAIGFVVNVTDEKDVEQTFADIKTQFGALHGLINSAGIMRDGLLLKVKDGQVVDKMSHQQFQSVIDVNITGTFLCAREAAQAMVETQSKGVIVNISSVSRAGNAGQSNYSASKAAVAAMTVTWAKELARFGIRTGCIAPGLVETAMAAQMRPDMRERFLSTVPLRRLAEPDEVASAARFIFENEYFTGRVLELDGGTRV
ncbi:SDR family oxidoreductase [Lacimicrobium alkaliphilum]|uniref:3-ketoacyl-ACP reductase n=1 Tax=Lacimicrobium alkaliphilum TaxID=1526571 RepID=A0ABQ1R092_9ALTE|nr:SDR family oxidoreductase [Lacimicrobium alkaliphilum]GGD53471.1 3-ketoacyl-ACP reductase [Lacimicrobium alkaliphilum]